MAAFTINYKNDETIQFLDNFTDVVYKAKASALRKAAKVVKDATVNAFKATGVSYAKNPKYNDTLIEGVRTTAIKDGDTIGVHILGTRASGSGTFRLRFFEHGTKERVAKQYNGKPLKKPKKLGKIPPKKFFEAAQTSSLGAAEQAFTQQFDKFIENNA